jgi:CDP-6-deoxy-D-xylo-4-hexulose-3-dehydrase
MRRLDHQNVVQLLYFFFISSSDRVRITHLFIYEVMTIQSFNFLFLSDGFNVRNTELHAVLGLSQLPKMNGYIDIRNKNYKGYLDICVNYKDYLHVIRPESGYSSFVLPFFFKDAKKKLLFQSCMVEEGIESRPLISGNLLRQPFLSQYYDPANFKNADFIHENAFYIGNNQFVDEARMERLSQLMKDFFSRH